MSISVSRRCSRDRIEGYLPNEDYLVVGANMDVETKFHTIKAGLNYKW